MEQASILVRDALRVQAIPQPSQYAGVASREGGDSRREFAREGWIALNANNLIWMALVIGGFLLTTLLIKG